MYVCMHCSVCNKIHCFYNLHQDLAPESIKRKLSGHFPYLCEWQHAELHTYIWHYNISVSTTASSFLVKNTSNESCYRSIMHSSSVNTLCFCLLVFPFINVLPQAGCLIPYPLLIPQGSQHMCICLTETPLRTCSENH